VNPESAGRQKPMQMELPLRRRGEVPEGQRSGEAPTMRSGEVRSGDDHLMERVVARGNVKVAWARVRSNGGSPGVDGMTVGQLAGYLMEHGKEVREQLLSGTYQPQAVRRQQIPKREGGVRELGIPCVLDRLIQQAILQVLQPMFDLTFSEHSHGFRPGRSAHDAVREAHGYLREGRQWVVDVDLEQFFDRVNHDVLMDRLARRIGDARLLRLIRRYLKAGIMAHGVVIERYEGTPQGGPLSPLLANVLLDEVDRELEHRGHAFVRYADDCNVYVRSQRAGERVMEALRHLYGRLRLKVNERKSAVGRLHERQFLGYSFWLDRQGEVKCRVAPKARQAFKRRVRKITRRNGGRSIGAVVADLRAYLPGWKRYFQLAQTPGILADLDGWIRHRLRALQLRQWKNGPTVYRKLRKMGMSHLSAARVAANRRRWWHNAKMHVHFALTTRYYDRIGVPQLAR